MPQLALDHCLLLIYVKVNGIMLFKKLMFPLDLCVFLTFTEWGAVSYMEY